MSAVAVPARDSAEPGRGPAANAAGRIRARLPEMPEAMRKVAQLVLDEPRAPLDCTIGELASRAGTSAASVTRFCHLLGYPGYAAFRVSIATDLGRTDARSSWTTDIGRAFGPGDSPAEVLSTLVNAHGRSLRDTAAVMDLALMQRIAAQIAHSRHVDIYGVGGSAVLAEEMEARLYRIGVNAHHWAEVHAGLTSAAIQDQECVALGISNTGRTVETIQMLREARQAGALTVAITNNPHSPLVEVADLAVITSVYEQFLQPDDLSAKHVQLLVLDLLYLLVAQEDFERTTSKLATTAVAVAGHRQQPRVGRHRPAADTRPSRKVPRWQTT